MRENRGFHFLVGLAVVWLFWRLLITGVLHDIGFLATGSYGEQYAFRGPGAIIIAFFIEAIIAIGAVAVLVVTGTWEVIYQCGSLVRDAFAGLVMYLDEWKSNRDKPAKSPEVSQQPEQPVEPVSESNPLIGAIIDTREQQQAQQIEIQRLNRKLAELIAAKASEDEATE